jgi:GTP1/Obg family GTP-binding protein
MCEFYDEIMKRAQRNSSRKFHKKNKKNNRLYLKIISKIKGYKNIITSNF